MMFVMLRYIIVMTIIIFHFPGQGLNFVWSDQFFLNQESATIYGSGN
jgi:hypothetical protein